MRVLRWGSDAAAQKNIKKGGRTPFFVSFAIHTNVKIFVSEHCGRGFGVVFEELYKGIFILKAALGGDFLDREFGVKKLGFHVL